MESEKRTRAERNKGIDHQIEIIQDLIYNRETGIAFELDRLKEKDKKRETIKIQVIGLYVAVGILILDKLISLIIK